MRQTKKNLIIGSLAVLITAGCFVLPLAVSAAISPTVLTKEPTTITANAIIVEGVITNDGGDKDLNAWFQYGKTDSFGSKSTIRTMDGRGLFSIRITGLESCTKYFYRAIAENEAGMGYGQTSDLKTYCPVVKGATDIDNGDTATDIGTGVVTDILRSILLPLAIALVLVWLFKSKLIGSDRYLAKRKQEIGEWRAQKKLAKILAKHGK